MENPLTIFLSHSSRDLEVVRKIRDSMEVLGFDPLMFCLHCLDDNKDTLEDFIKQEIDARNVFVYCKSPNAESSPWVQKELEYIAAKPFHRFYEIDITRPFDETLPELLLFLSELKRRNTVFLGASKKDQALYDQIASIFRKRDFTVLSYGALVSREDIENKIDLALGNGYFVPIITNDYINSRYCMTEFEIAIESERLDRICPLLVNLNDDSVRHLLRRAGNYEHCVKLETDTDLINEESIIALESGMAKL